ncbi:MAG: YebC/PmpR family DNA-binding transcriptional regulator, partial [Kiritimatiellae bacterium]|nr:YebC/PmpR family DNA-binding transcriptional regulator [Kiritimatiellia bacterium]
EEKGVPTVSSEIVYLPMEGTTVAVSDLSQAKAVLKFVDALDENDDVQNVYHNADIADEIMEKIEAEA